MREIDSKADAADVIAAVEAIKLESREAVDALNSDINRAGKTISFYFVFTASNDDNKLLIE